MTKAGRSNYKPFWGRCQFPRSTHTYTYTHCCVLLGGEADILEAKLSVPKCDPSRAEARGLGYVEAAERIGTRRASGEEKRSFIRTSEMRSGPPCALRHWQRLQPASRWRLGSYSFSADRLPTFIVSSLQDPPIPRPASRYVFFDIVSN